MPISLANSISSQLLDITTLTLYHHTYSVTALLLGRLCILPLYDTALGGIKSPWPRVKKMSYCIQNLTKYSIKLHFSALGDN